MANNITFPRLGISLNISPAAFHIGQKEIYWYALIILTGFFAGIALASWGCEKRGLKKENVLDIALYGIAFGILGARLYYVIFAWKEFSHDILGIFRIWEGGLAIYGGIIAACISTIIYCRAKKLNILNALDVCCVGLLLGQAIGRWGNFTNCEVFGRATSIIFGMSINGRETVHPLFLYESMWNLAGVVLILLVRDKKTRNGQVFALYLFWYSLGRLFLEGMRDSSYILWLIPDKLGISQAIAVIIMIVAVAIFVLSLKSDKECFKIKE